MEQSGIQQVSGDMDDNAGYSAMWPAEPTPPVDVAISLIPPGHGSSSDDQ